MEKTVLTATSTIFDMMGDKLEDNLISLNSCSFETHIFEISSSKLESWNSLSFKNAIEKKSNKKTLLFLIRSEKNHRLKQKRERENGIKKRERSQ